MKLIPKIGYVYCLWSFQFPWRYKVGWSASPDYRLAEIERSMQEEYGRTIKVNRALKMPLLFAYNFEQAIHRSFFWRPVNGMRGSGFTEWSYWLNFITAIVATAIALIMSSPAKAADVRLDPIANAKCMAAPAKPRPKYLHV